MAGVTAASPAGHFRSLYERNILVEFVYVC